MENCSPLLEASLKRAESNLGHSFIHDEDMAARVEAVIHCPSNRAGARLLMACMLAKVHRPEIDPRKPYT
jgi:DNA adenine methylase